jgi:hypothetical protein
LHRRVAPGASQHRRDRCALLLGTSVAGSPALLKRRYAATGKRGTPRKPNGGRVSEPPFGRSPDLLLAADLASQVRREL